MAEIIIVDDGSTDDTQAVIGALAATDPRIRLLHREPSQGAASARNLGVRHSSGQWICFLDSDDAWHPSKHEVQRDALTARPEAIASFTGLTMVYRDKRVDKPLPATVELETLLQLNILDSTSTAMVRRSAFDQAGGFDPGLKSCQDWDLWIKLARIGPFALVPDCLVDFTQESNNRISNNLDAQIDGHATVFARTLDGVSDRSLRRRIKAQHQLTLAHMLLWRANRPSSALVRIARALLLHPSRTGVELGKNALRRMSGR